MTNETRMVGILSFLSESGERTIQEIVKNAKQDYYSIYKVVQRLVSKGLLELKDGKYKISEAGKRLLNSINSDNSEELERQRKEKEKWEREEKEMAMLEKRREEFTERVKDYFLNGFEENMKPVKAKITESATKGEVCELDWPSFYKFIGMEADLIFSDPKEAFKIMISIIKKEIDIRSIPLDHFLMFKNLKEVKSLYRQISHLRTEDEGKFVIIKGTVSADNDISSYVYSVRQRCSECGWDSDLIELSYPERPKNLRKCPLCGKEGTVTRQEEKENRLLIVLEEDISETGNEPENIPCVLQPHLCIPKYTDQFRAGQRVIFSGIVRERKTFKERENDPLMNYKRWFDVISFDKDDSDWAEILQTPEDIKKIRELALLPDEKLKEILINSFCPHLVHLNVAKEAAILSMVGGTDLRTPATVDENGKVKGPFKAKPIHLLFVGDPSTGKTDMFDFIEKTAPKVRRASGRGTTTAGLTASVIQNPETGRWGVQAGLMVLANKGTLIIDEAGLIHKDELGVLRDAMQSCRIIISKAGKAEYKAETTIIMGKNPKYSRFDPSGDLREQIELDEALLSRFAFVIPFFDRPESDKDRSIAKSVLGRGVREFSAEVLPSTFLKKLIAFVKTEITEVSISDEIAERLEEYYDRTRQKGIMNDRTVVSIYPRNITALRLAIQANARLHLRKEATLEDFEAATRLFNSYLALAGIDPETGKIDMDRITGTSSARRSKFMKFNEIFDSLAKSDNSKVVKMRIFIDELERNGISRTEAEKMIKEALASADFMAPRVDELRRVV